MNSELRQRNLTTADIVASTNTSSAASEEADASAPSADVNAVAATQREQLAPLFTQQVAGEFRSRWNLVQQGFVDDPRNAVRQGDELVVQVIKSLAESFSAQRAGLEGEQASTENLRLALRRYRSFFERLLSI